MNFNLIDNDDDRVVISDEGLHVEKCVYGNVKIFVTKNARIEESEETKSTSLLKTLKRVFMKSYKDPASFLFLESRSLIPQKLCVLVIDDDSQVTHHCGLCMKTKTFVDKKGVEHVIDEYYVGEDTDHCCLKISPIANTEIIVNITLKDGKPFIESEMFDGVTFHKEVNL